MNYKYIVILIILMEIFLISASGDNNKRFDEKNKTLYIIDSKTDKILMSVQQIDEESDLTSIEETYNITSYENYTFDKNKDFKVIFQRSNGNKDIYNMIWQRLENIEYNVTIPDIMESEENRTISDIISHTDITENFDFQPRRLDWGEMHDRYKWVITSLNGTLTIGFDHFLINESDPSNITFYRIGTENIGNHTEPKYRTEWRTYQPIGTVIKKNESIILKFTAYKKAETGKFSLKTIPMFAGVEEENLTWWNGSWAYNINNQIPNGTRPYQLSLTLSNSSGVNNATHVFLNGHANKNFTDIRFTLNNETILPYWIENNTTGTVWINIIDNGTLNLYYGNPDATSSLSDGKATFEFFDDFSGMSIGSNPVLSPTQPWEGPNLRWGTISYLNGTYYIFYANSSGSTGSIGRATSTDLVNWNKYPGNPLILNSIGPSLLKELDGVTPVFYNGKYWMLTMKSDGSRIELRSAPSLDSTVWTLENGDLINPVPATWYGTMVFTTSFIRENNTFHIFMEARNDQLDWNIGHFTAPSPEGAYTSLGVLISPTFSWEYLGGGGHGGVLDPEMRKFDNVYYLFYTGALDKPYYNNSYTTSGAIGGPFTKTQIQITRLGQTYSAILAKDTYYYVLTDDHMTNSTLGTGKNLFVRKDLGGMFGSPFEWNKGGNPTISGSSLLINQDGEYIRSGSAFLYKAMKIRAKFGPVPSSYQYLGFGASPYGGDLNAEMFFSFNSPDLKASSGNANSTNTSSVYNLSYFGSYHNYEILWRNGEAKFLIDDVLRATQTAYVADSPQPVGIYDYATNEDFYVDWLFVRNYVYPEPTFAVWPSEGTQINAPDITAFTPPSPVETFTGDSVTFNITVSQPVNVTWYLNGIVVKDSEKGVTHASFTNSSALQGTWMVNVSVISDNGSDSTEWTWNVVSPSVPVSITFVNPTPANGSTTTANYGSVNTSINGSSDSTAFIDWNYSLIAWWRFNNEPGETPTSFKDWSGHGNNGMCSGITCPVSTTGKFGNALSFDGLNNYIDTGSIASGNSGTMLAWINPGGDYTGNQAIMGGLDNAGSDASARYSIIARSSDCPTGDWRTVIANGVSAQNICSGQIYNATNFPTGVWKQIAVTFDGSVVNLYLDDKLIQSVVQNVSAAGNAQPYAIGRFGGYNGFYFNGMIDETRIYARALNMDEIRASYNAGNFRLSRNFTNLPSGSYSFRAYVQNASGLINQTETRTFTVTSMNVSTALSISFVDPTPANGSTIMQNNTFINTSITSATNTTAFIDWNGSLAAWWRFNNETGENQTLFRDSSTHSITGSCSGNTCPVLVSGKFGNALQFDGMNNYVDAGNNGSITGSLTITAWIRRGSNSGWRTIVSKGESTLETYQNYALYVSPGNTLTLGFGNSDGVTYREFDTTNPIDTGWHHIAAVIDSGGSMKIYVDGVSQPGILSGDPSISLTANSKKLLIGSSSATTEFFDGVIDELTIWNRVLSTDEINASYNSGLFGLSGAFINLKPGSYNYKAYVQNASGMVNQTELRTLTVGGSSNLSISFIDPTPADGATISQNLTVINTFITNGTNSTAFIDWNRSLVSWWRYNNETGETPAFFRDWSGNGNNGSCSGLNCPVSTSGRFGNALLFNGMNDYIDAGNMGNVTGNLTITAWIKIGGNSGWRTVVSKGESTLETYQNYALYVSPGNTLSLGFGNNDGVTYREFDTAVSLDNGWHHIAAVINSAVDMKIYIDGISSPGTYSGNPSTVLTGNSRKLLIGSSSTTTEFFNGSIDEVTIWNRALDLNEIKASYNAGIYGLSRNFTNLHPGSYYYRAYVQNASGNVNHTETRKLTIVGEPGLITLQNNATYLITPTYDGSGQATHPDIYYNASGWNGYKYWMTITPYPGGDAQFENPSILVSNEGIIWNVPAGLNNPIDFPSAGEDSDNEIVFNENLNRLEVYFIEAGTGTSFFRRKTSIDGIHWSNEQDIFNLTDYQIMSPGIIRKNGIYHMWYTGSSSCSAPTSVKYRNSADGIFWSNPQDVNIDLPGQNIWHLDVEYIPTLNEYWMVYAAYPSSSDCGNTELYFAKSLDKINWIMYPNKLIAKSTSWDSAEIYRSTFLFDADKDLLRIWYSARNSTDVWHIGYTEGIQ